MKYLSFLNNNLIKNWLPLIVWLVLIFCLSHQPNLKSGLAAWLDLILRKIAHITEFAILTFLFWRALRLKNKKNRILIAMALSLLYALSDEYHQSFILGRDGNWRDIGIDSLGILLAGLFLELKTFAGSIMAKL